MEDKYKVLLEQGKALQESGYRFITPTPESHKRVLERSAGQRAATSRDVFGWNRKFSPKDSQKLGISESVLQELRDQKFITHPNQQSGDDLLRSNIRYSSARPLNDTPDAKDLLFVHSGYPTVQEDSIFFGPDSYRYLNFLRDKVATLRENFSSIVDIGSGSGVGGLFFKDVSDEILLTDINDLSFQYQLVNTELNNVPKGKVFQLKSDIMKQIEQNKQFDLVVSNPPYMVDTSRETVRAYRNGGGDRGIELSLRIVRESIPYLRSGGILALYTGVPIVDGLDVFSEAILKELYDNKDLESVHYYEIDPDVFGEELSTEVYGDVDRIAVTGLVLVKK
ncbi:hypothetical protein AKO1_007513 [Acrasis kona]|uniref:Methyltransferase small domain-containing protein n=1 Tax=Acrasis kona TaxID=1008807 RepID=A0AAW2YRG3_9EUKA